MEEIGGPSTSLNNFRILYLITQMIGATIVILIGSWVGVHLGGLSWTSKPEVQFNWHPLLMSLGMIFLYGNSILIYRGFRYARKKPLKITHAAIHAAAFIFTVIALVAVFDSHNLAQTPIPNMYSLHSWIGLSAVILFSFQYLFGFISYLAPGVRDQLKEQYMPIHVFCGILGFVMAIAAALLGLNEKAFFTMEKEYSQLPAQAVLVNVVGLLYVVYGALVVYLVTERSYKRQALPDDVMLLTRNTSE